MPISLEINKKFFKNKQTIIDYTIDPQPFQYQLFTNKLTALSGLRGYPGSQPAGTDIRKVVVNRLGDQFSSAVKNFHRTDQVVFRINF